jgi:hypothetical protein
VHWPWSQGASLILLVLELPQNAVAEALEGLSRKFAGGVGCDGGESAGARPLLGGSHQLGGDSTPRKVPLHVEHQQGQTSSVLLKCKFRPFRSCTLCFIVLFLGALVILSVACVMELLNDKSVMLKGQGLMEWFSGRLCCVRNIHSAPALLTTLVDIRGEEMFLFPKAVVKRVIIFNRYGFQQKRGSFCFPFYVLRIESCLTLGYL